MCIRLFWTSRCRGFVVTMAMVSSLIIPHGHVSQRMKQQSADRMEAFIRKATQTALLDRMLKKFIRVSARVKGKRKKPVTLVVTGFFWASLNCHLEFADAIAILEFYDVLRQFAFPLLAETVDAVISIPGGHGQHDPVALFQSMRPVIPQQFRQKTIGNAVRGLLR